MKKTANISVFATNYNNGEFLVDFMESILNSTMQPREIIFVDDGSTDKSLEVMERYKNLPHLKIIAFDKNKGRSAALNEGKKHCSAKYTMLIDPDDKLLSDRIEKQWSYMESHPQIDVLGANVQYFKSGTGQNLNTSKFSVKNIFETYKKGENGVLQPTVIIKTELYKQYDYIEMVPGQDYQLFARMIVEGARFANLPDIVNLMRVHEKSAVSNITYQSLSKIFTCRDQIFNTQTSRFRKYMYYRYLKTYRKAMLTENTLIKYALLLFAIAFQPGKLLKRLGF